MVSEELKAKLLSWRHPGFSIHVGRPIPPNDTRAIEDMAGYVVRNPVSLKRLVHVDRQQAVIYRGLRTNPSLGANKIKRILDHLGLSPPEIERPPPDIHYVPVDDEGRELNSVGAEELPSREGLGRPAGRRGASPFAGRSPLRRPAAGPRQS